MDSCVFCRIIAGELPSSQVLDSDLVVAFLDIRPANPGHTLVVPRRHVESFTNLSRMEVEQLALCGQRIATALKQGFDACEAVTFSLADGAAAGQDVPHTHLHVVPRRTGDGLGWRAAGQLQDRNTLDLIASRLKMALGVFLRAGQTTGQHDPFATD
jgi:histidine triad (HIT) family protein